MSNTHAFFACLIILSLATAAAAQNNLDQQNASISGRVTLSGQPIRGIKVSLVPGPYGSPETPGRQSARTDENGRYEFKGLAAGRYGLIAATYIYASDDLFSSQNRPFKVCTVMAAEKLEGQDIRLTRGGVITGRITGADGRPVIVENVQLTFVDSTGKRLAFPFYNPEMALTDDRGVYRLYSLPPGHYLVSVGREIGQGGIGSGAARGFFRRVYYPDVNEIEQAKLIEVKAGGEVTDIDIRLGPPEKTFAVSGRVVDAVNGQRIPGAMIDFGAADNKTKRLQGYAVGTPVNERAEFHLGGLPPGSYAISGTADATRNYYGEPVEFEIKDEDIEGLEVKMLRGASINGAVVIEGLADPVATLQSARVSIRPRRLDPGQVFEGRQPPPVRVEPNGSFQVKALPPGRIRLEIGSEGDNLHLVRIERGGAEIRDAFNLNPGEQVTGVRMVLSQAAGALRGRVNLPGALPEGWALEVTARRVDGGEQSERSFHLDSNNSFLAQSLPAGDYEIIVKVTNKNAGDSQHSIEPLRRRVNVRDGSTTEVVLTVELPR
ncbi:MAG TPA: carboxypeptidase-like regulatory domain-containing protein [Blastocatellia bacterium]|nr:carboxypeptidase-like regulatory domain-containing protein [Blastocatellia bacterium]